MLDGRIPGGRFLQFIDIPGQRGLHIVERVPEQAEFVLVLDGRQRSVELAGRDFLGRFSELDERRGGFLDGAAAGEEDEEDAQQDQEDDDGAVGDGGRQQAFGRDDDSHGPSGMEQRRVIDIGPDSIHDDRQVPGFSGSHHIAQLPVPVGILAGGIVIEVGLEDPVRVRMRDIVAVRSDDETVDPLFRVVLRRNVKDGFLILLPDTLLDEGGQPVDGEVRPEDAGDFLFGLHHHGAGERAEDRFAPVLVQIRVGPGPFGRGHSLGIPLGLEVVVGF